jgi:hypothetical protein
LGLGKDASFSDFGIGFLPGNLFDFKLVGSKIVGPFGVFAVILSLLIPLSFGLFFSYVYKRKTRDLIKDRRKTKKLEEEFTNSLFQLGNRLGNNIPAEIAFSRVAESTRGQVTEGFFKIVNQNLQQLGMGLEEAIFNKKRGAIIYYPSSLIATSMKILVESVKRGLDVAARSLMSISQYIKNIKKIDERLRDLLAEVVSDMKSNMTFLAPLLAGIVVGLATMITVILNKLEMMFEAGGMGEAGVSGIGSVEGILEIFDLTSMVSPYFLQVAIGIYIIEIIFILTSTLITVDAGQDKLRNKNEIGKNLKRGLLLYAIVALVSIFALSLLAGVALGGI